MWKLILVGSFLLWRDSYYPPLRWPCSQFLIFLIWTFMKLFIFMKPEFFKHGLLPSKFWTYGPILICMSGPDNILMILKAPWRVGEDAVKRYYQYKLIWVVCSYFFMFKSVSTWTNKSDIFLAAIYILVLIKHFFLILSWLSVFLMSKEEAVNSWCEPRGATPRDCVVREVWATTVPHAVLIKVHLYRFIVPKAVFTLKKKK